MVAQIAERWDSRAASIDWTRLDSGIELTFVIVDMSGLPVEDTQVHALMLAEVPAEYEGFFYQSYSIERKGYSVWHATARYAPNDLFDVTWSGDTSGGTAHVTQSKKTLARYARHEVDEDTIPDYRGAINVSDNGVGGVDIVVPVFNFSATYAVPREQFTPAYRLVLFGLTGKVNSHLFYGLQRGEALFQGATWTDKKNSPFVEVGYKFAGLPNKDDIRIDGVTQDPTVDSQDPSVQIPGWYLSKEGWQYLWILYRDKVESGKPFLVKQPEFVFIEQLYDYGPFHLLGLGA